MTLAEHETELLPARTVAALPYPVVLRANLLLLDNPAKREALMKEIEKRIGAMPGPDAWCAARFELDRLALLCVEGASVD
ncbi:MAG TPA: hypothetical protein VMU57_18255 [Edaphobacter sp.]|uniref:hypothetical protein n=1 Tax=Edaphobacter sp. TaxID=1934404 RepID=UPI002C062054|nr:hypothetical protein [Edaphobacter sp.]HUZ96851.1 hypothetical protein [Edaphobacter sp.]